MTRAPLLLATWLAACVLGCGAAPVAYPSTEAEWTGFKRARYEASRYLDCEDVEVIPVAPREVCDAAGECRLVPELLGGQLLARGCGEELRFYCDGVCGAGPHPSHCLSEPEMTTVFCGML